MDSLYINGVDRTNYLRVSTPDMEFQLNTRAMFDLEFLDTSGAVRPDLGQEVIYTRSERALTVSGSAGSPTVTASVGIFVAGDVGKAIVIPGAGTAGATFHVKIITHLSSSQVAVEFNLVTAVATAAARVGERKFAGLIVDLEEQPFYADSGIQMRLTCADFNAAAETVLINGISSAGTGTLREHVDWSLTSGLTSSYGIQRDPAMAAGPTLGVLGYSFKYIMDVWKDLSVRTGWVFFVDQLKVVRWIQVGTIVAPIDIDSTLPLANTLKIGKSYNQYRNSQWVWYGGTAAAEYTETGTGNGSQTRWTLEGAPVGGILSRGYITVTESSITYDLQVGREGTGSLQWNYNPLTNELVRPTAFGSGDTWSLTYLNQFPLVVNRTDSAGITAHRLRSLITQNDAILTRAEAESFADDLLRRYSRVPRTIEFDTYNDDLTPGMTVTVDLTNRGISPIDFLIDSVSTKDDGSGSEDEHLIYTIHAIEGEEFQNLWIEFYRDAGGGSLGSGAGSPAPAPTPVPESVYPQVLGLTSFATTALVNNYIITFPAHNTGDLLVVFVGHNSHNDLTVNAVGSSSGWTRVFFDDIALGLPAGAMFRKIATSNAEQLAVSNATSNYGVWIAMTIANGGTVEVSASVVVNPAAANTDPPNFTPTTGSDDYLWLVFLVTAGGSAPTPPTGFGNMVRLQDGWATGYYTVARREETAASKNPGAWTHTSSVAVTWTISIRPAS